MSVNGADRNLIAMRPTPLRGFVLLIYALATAMSVSTATDPDLWWHLRTGDVIVSTGIPRSDIFSFTVPGREWITHEWGSQVLMWGLWSAGGAAALIIIFTALIVGAFALAHRTSTARTPVTTLIVLLAAATARPATAPRPQMFNLLLLALLIYLLERIRRGSLRAGWLWASVPLLMVWSNLHSGYLLGVVTLAVYAVGERLERRRSNGRPMPSRAITQLPLVAGAAFLVAAVNPNGIAMWTYPLVTLRSDAMRTYINEWHSPDFQSSWFWPFIAFMMVATVSLIASARKPGWTQALMLFGTALAGLQSIRHIPLFAIVAIPIVAEQVEVAWDAARANVAARRSTVASSTPIAWLTGALGITIGILIISAAIGNTDDAIAEIYPVDAVDTILTSELAEARGYNEYGWGGYLIWRGVPVFIDGRADVYGDEFMYLYFQAEDAEAGWREPLDTFAVDYALLAPDAALGVVLDEAEEWTSVYDDGIAEIFVRCTNDCPVLAPA
ncbi:MAG: hypothetical protein ACC660_02370 [Acidimicrobiales bacterium]